MIISIKDPATNVILTHKGVRGESEVIDTSHDSTDGVVKTVDLNDPHFGCNYFIENGKIVANAYLKVAVAVLTTPQMFDLN